ncbi:MAG: hypothetical protein Q7T72_11495 [Bacteroidales bacterium]|nr:hypothetical protein [Bacteroidales bacterium]
MFEKIITNLKLCLPESLRNKIGDNTESVNVEENNNNSHGSSNNINISASQEQKKNQASTIIRVVVVIGLGYLAVDHFFLTNEPAEQAVVKPRKARKPKDNSIIVPVTAVTPTLDKGEHPATVTEPSEEKTSEKTENISSSNAAPVENINLADKKIEDTAPVKIEEKVSENIPSKEEVVTAVPKVSETKSGEHVDQSLDSLIDAVDGKKETNIADKIVADDVYTEPPLYEPIGRGLVYNCKEKHWACIDKSSYINCNKNMKWNKAHAKPAECVVSNVYNSEEDCSTMQKYNISTSSSTNFCN